MTYPETVMTDFGEIPATPLIIKLRGRVKRCKDGSPDMRTREANWLAYHEQRLGDVEVVRWLIENELASIK